jgi:hypothetical protein
MNKLKQAWAISSSAYAATRASQQVSTCQATLPGPKAKGDNKDDESERRQSTTSWWPSGDDEL